MLSWALDLKRWPRSEGLVVIEVSFHGLVDRAPWSVISRMACTPAVTVIYVTLHHEMSRNVPDGHFHVLYFLKVNSMLFAMVETIFKSED